MDAFTEYSKCIILIHVAYITVFLDIIYNIKLRNFIKKVLTRKTFPNNNLLDDKK